MRISQVFPSPVPKWAIASSCGNLRQGTCPPCLQPVSELKRSIPPCMSPSDQQLAVPHQNNSASAANPSRRQFVRGVSGALASAAALSRIAAAQAAKPNQSNEVQLSEIHAATDQPEKAPGPFLPPNRRVGFAIVGLGRLSLNQILPAFAKSEYCKPVALVSGDRTKALKIAAQYGIAESNITDYAGYEKLKDMPGVDVIYIVLPNGLHREFVVRGAKTGKHILCEKPMANSAAECEEMIAACKQADIKLMIAYRQQYEPMNRTLEKAVRDGKLGKLRSVVASNSQNQGDPTQWRLNKKLAGGGCMPDVGIYCLNAARFLSGEEPEEVFATVVQPKDDPRFKEVEARCEVIARFPSGLTTNFTCSYDIHRSTFLRLEGSEAFGEMDPGVRLPRQQVALFQARRRQGGRDGPVDRRQRPIRAGDGPHGHVRPEQSGAAHAGRRGTAGSTHRGGDLQVGGHRQERQATAAERFHAWTGTASLGELVLRVVGCKPGSACLAVFRPVGNCLLLCRLHAPDAARCSLRALNE